MLVKAGALHHSMCDRVSFQSLSRDYNVSRKLEKGKLRIEMLDYIEEKYKIDIKDIPRKGLVLELLLFEGSGNDVHDTSSYGNHGLSADGYGIFGATWTKLTTVKYVLRTDGIDDYISIPDSDSLDLTTLTIVVWVKIPTITWTGYNRIIHKLDGLAWPPDPWQLVVRDSGAVAIIIGNGSTYNKTTDADSLSNFGRIDDGKWHFIVGIVSGSELLLYIDNKLIATATQTITPTVNTEPVLIAKASVKYMPMTLGLVRLYNRALSESEISEIYEIEKYMFG